MPLLIDVYTKDWDERGPDAPRHLTIVNVSGPFEPSEHAPPFRLVAHDHYRDYPVLIPVVEARPGFRGPMAGSDYAGSSDSRWRDAVAKITGTRSCDLVVVHDDYEVVE